MYQARKGSEQYNAQRNGKMMSIGKQIIPQEWKIVNGLKEYMVEGIVHHATGFGSLFVGTQEDHKFLSKE